MQFMQENSADPACEKVCIEKSVGENDKIHGKMSKSCRQITAAFGHASEIVPAAAKTLAIPAGFRYTETVICEAGYRLRQESDREEFQ